MFTIVIISSSIHEESWLSVRISSILLYVNLFSTTLLILTFLAFPFTSLTNVTQLKILPDLLIFHQIQIITNILRSKLQESEHKLKGRQHKSIWKRRKWIVIHQHNIMNFNHTYRSTKASTSRLVTIISGSWFTLKYTDFIVCFNNHYNS